MDFWIKAAQLILSLSILIVLHEMGHMIPAKLFKTRVEKFYLFFNPWFSLFKVKRGETEYGIGWIPLGGYVKISGMIDESMDKDQMDKPPEPYEFRSKPAWQRLIIMIGGVTVNLVLGYIIYIGVLHKWGVDRLEGKNAIYGITADSLALEYGFQNGDIINKIEGEEAKDILDINSEIMLFNKRNFEVTHSNGLTEVVSLPEDFDYKMLEKGSRSVLAPRFPFVIDSVIASRPGEKSGFIKGDSIIAFNNKPIQFFDEFELEKTLLSESDSAFDVTVIRDGQEVVVNTWYTTEGKNEKKHRVVGLVPKGLTSYLTINHDDFSFGASIPAGMAYGSKTLVGYVKSLKFLFTKTGASQIGGFGTIGGLFGNTWNWKRFWAMTAFLSIILAFMNILPIPALDGGHVMFLLFEMIAGRPPSQKFMERAQVVGMMILLSLLLYANGNDIVRAWFS